MKQTVDFSHVEARHDGIHYRLEEWARWVRVKPHAWATQPMFRFVKSNARQWETDPHIHVEINTLAAHEIERAVSFLPEQHRTATRWAYVFSHIPVNAVRRELGVTREALNGLIVSSRDMLNNRLRQKIVDNS